MPINGPVVQKFYLKYLTWITGGLPFVVVPRFGM